MDSSTAGATEVASRFHEGCDKASSTVVRDCRGVDLEGTDEGR